MYILHLSLVGVVALLGLLDTSPTTQKPFRKFQRYLLERTQTYTPGALNFLSQRNGDRVRDLEANEPVTPLRASSAPPAAAPRSRRLNRPPVCPPPRSFVPKSRKPTRILTPKEAHSTPMSPVKPKRSQHARQEQQYEDKTKNQNCSAETHAALSPIIVTVALMVFTILKTRGSEKRKRLIQNLAHGYQAANLVPKTSVRESTSVVLAKVVDSSDPTDINNVVKNVAIQQDLILNANQGADDPFVAQELEYVDGRLPVAISFELPGKLVPIDSGESIYEPEDGEEPDGDSISSSVSSSSENSSEELQALQSNAHARAPTTERRAPWTAARADAATNWRERRDEQRPRVAANGWQAVNAYLGRASPEKRPARQMPTRLAPEWAQDNQVRANA